LVCGQNKQFCLKTRQLFLYIQCDIGSIAFEDIVTIEAHIDHLSSQIFQP
jgi:hypothetical protein